MTMRMLVAMVLSNAARVAFAIATLVVVSPAWAGWSSSPYEHVRITNQPLREAGPSAVSDGRDGAIIAWWTVTSDPFAARVFAQRISASGVPSWGEAGVQASSTSLGAQRAPQIVSDGDGGAIVVWGELPPSGVWADCRLRAQRFDADGHTVWGDAGVLVAPSIAANPYRFAIAADGAGGVVIAWSDVPSAIPGIRDWEKLKVQRISPTGDLMWGESGKPVSDSEGPQTRPVITTSAIGTVGIAWETGPFVCVQSLSATGDTLWDGARILSSESSTGLARILADGEGGWTVLWNADTARLQRLNHAGGVLWEASGVAAFDGDQRFVGDAIPDGAGGAILLSSRRISSYQRVSEVQRLLGSGARGWGPEGIRILPDDDGHDPVLMVSDGSGGAFCLWHDFTVGIFNSAAVHAQRFTPSGERLWVRSGVPVNLDAPGIGEVGVATKGGMIAIWTDTVDGKNVAHRVDESGSLGIDTMAVTPTLTIDRVRPNPSNGDPSLIRFRVPGVTHVRVEISNVRGGHVRRLWSADCEPGMHSLYWDGIDDSGRRVPAGVYYVEVSTNSESRSQKIVRLD